MSNPRVMEPLEDDSSEYAEGRNESLSLFGAALGGALLGMLLTLLVLAVLNNGSLRFDTAAGSERLLLIEDQVGVLDESVRNVNENVRIVTENLSSDIEQGQTEIRGQVDTIVSELDGQGLTLDELGETLGSLEQTRDEFNIFVGALNEALSAIEADEAVSTPATVTEGTAGSAIEDSATADAPIASTIQPLVETSAQVPTSGVAVLFFRDANGNGQFDAGESAIEGLPVSLLDEDGETLSSATTGNAGLLFRNVPNGNYTVAVNGDETDALNGDALGEVTVTNEGDGQLLYFPVAVE